MRPRTTPKGRLVHLLDSLSIPQIYRIRYTDRSTLNEVLDDIKAAGLIPAWRIIAALNTACLVWKREGVPSDNLFIIWKRENGGAWFWRRRSWESGPVVCDTLAQLVESIHEYRD